MLFLSIMSCTNAERGSYRSLVTPQETLLLPPLPYQYGELEPYIDAATVQVHYEGHHKAYTDKTNAALKEWQSSVSKEVVCQEYLIQWSYNYSICAELITISCY